MGSLSFADGDAGHDAVTSNDEVCVGCQAGKAAEDSIVLKKGEEDKRSDSEINNIVREGVNQKDLQEKLTKAVEKHKNNLNVLNNLNVALEKSRLENCPNGDCLKEKIKSCSEIKDLSSLKVGTKCKTSKDKIFERVKDEVLGFGWKEQDEKNEKGEVIKGMTWGDKVVEDRNISYDNAINKYGDGTKDKSKFLPSKADFERLLSSFELDKTVSYTKLANNDKGSKEFYSLFPHMKDRWFWSSSVYDANNAYGFSGNFGCVGNYYRDFNYGFVVCVGRR